MIFNPPLERATLVKRYKRFLADVTTQEGETTTIHCPNTGAMTGCNVPGSTVWMQRSANPKRKYPYSWELVEVAGGTLVGINTGRSNALVGEAIANGLVSLWDPNWPRRAEVRFGEERSRVDWRLDPPDDKPWYIEVKNVTAANALATHGADLFEKEDGKRAQGKDKISDKIFEIERRLLVKRRPA